VQFSPVLALTVTMPEGIKLTPACGDTTKLTLTACCAGSTWANLIAILLMRLESADGKAHKNGFVVYCVQGPHRTGSYLSLYEVNRNWQVKADSAEQENESRRGDVEVLSLAQK
jgi:hypothetical protein